VFKSITVKITLECINVGQLAGILIYHLEWRKELRAKQK